MFPARSRIAACAPDPSKLLLWERLPSRDQPGPALGAGSRAGARSHTQRQTLSPGGPGRDFARRRAPHALFQSSRRGCRLRAPGVRARASGRKARRRTFPERARPTHGRHTSLPFAPERPWPPAGTDPRGGSRLSHAPETGQLARPAAHRAPSSTAEAVIPRGNEPRAHDTTAVAASGHGLRGSGSPGPAPAALTRSGTPPGSRAAPGAPTWSPGSGCPPSR